MSALGTTTTIQALVMGLLFAKGHEAIIGKLCASSTKSYSGNC